MVQPVGCELQPRVGLPQKFVGLFAFVKIESYFIKYRIAFSLFTLYNAASNWGALVDSMHVEKRVEKEFLEGCQGIKVHLFMCMSSCSVMLSFFWLDFCNC